MHSGWVSGDYVEVHPEGSSNSEGRTNPTLEKDGYHWVEVKNGEAHLAPTGEARLFDPNLVYNR